MTNYWMPPKLKDAKRKKRGAGFEFEFGDISVNDATAAMAEAVDGSNIDDSNPFEIIIKNSRIGKIKVERDALVLKKREYRQWIEERGLAIKENLDIDNVLKNIESFVDRISGTLVPCEVVTAPIPLDQFQELTSLVDALEKAGAEGTQSKPHYAFGLHINTGVPSFDGEELANYLKAFALLYDWIIRDSDTDLTRRFLTKFIDPFPSRWSEIVLANGYHPTLDELMKDYLVNNPTRNRPLDMLPIFACVDPELVQSSLANDEEQGLVSARPAFHYRLPDCRIGKPGWSVHQSWNHWVMVERLAARPELIREMADIWLAWHHRGVSPSISEWLKKLSPYIEQLQGE